MLGSVCFFFFFKQKTAYEMRISDWSSDVCSSDLPKRYRNEHGQLMEHAPFCERDMKLPRNLETHDEQGDFKIVIKKEGLMYPYTYGTHPFDFVGWDGYHFPWGFSIHNFEPITGRLHQPQPVHSTFETDHFVDRKSTRLNCSN